MRSDRERLADVIRAADQILDRSIDRRAFDEDPTLQVWAIHYIGVMGEAVRHLSDELRTSNPEIDWIGIGSMRNRLVHGYFDIDLELVWRVVTSDIPAVREQVATIVARLEER